MAPATWSRPRAGDAAAPESGTRAGRAGSDPAAGAAVRVPAVARVPPVIRTTDGLAAPRPACVRAGCPHPHRPAGGRRGGAAAGGRRRSPAPPPTSCCGPFLLQPAGPAASQRGGRQRQRVRQCFLSGGNDLPGRGAQRPGGPLSWLPPSGSGSSATTPNGSAVVDVTANIASLSQLDLSDRQRAGVHGATRTETAPITSADGVRLRVTARPIQLAGRQPSPW